MIWGLHYVSIGLYWLTVSVLKIKCCVGELQQMVKGPRTLQHLQDYKDYDSKHNLCYNAITNPSKHQFCNKSTNLMHNTFLRRP